MRYLLVLIGITAFALIGCKDSHGPDDDSDTTDLDEVDIDYYENGDCCGPEEDIDYDDKDFVITLGDKDIDTTDEDMVVCTPGDIEKCSYTGPEGTENVGACIAATRTCKATGTWGNCAGEIHPIYEICDNGIDEDCNGTVDDLDVDSDGYTECGETPDCCAWIEQCCPYPHDCCTFFTPQEVHPSAVEKPNGIDDNCDGQIDEGFGPDEILLPDMDDCWAT